MYEPIKRFVRNYKYMIIATGVSVAAVVGSYSLLHRNLKEDVKGLETNLTTPIKELRTDIRTVNNRLDNANREIKESNEKLKQILTETETVTQKLDRNTNQAQALADDFNQKYGGNQ